MMTFTPRRGLSPVVREFFPKCDNEEKFYVRMELDEAMHADGTSHLTDEDRELIRNRYPEYMRDARLRGLPMLGSGLVYPISDERILEPVCEPGKHWRHIAGIDLGGASSPTAWAWLCLDPLPEVWHLIHTYKNTDPRISVHAASIMANARHVPFAWPHDANVKDTHGDKKKFSYQAAGVRMLKDPARFPANEGGGNHVEDGIGVIYNLMEEGRFKVSAHLTDFWDEKRTYHRIQGKLNKDNDHLLDAVRYAMMCSNHARTISNRMRLPHRANYSYDPLNPNAARGRMSDRYPNREPHDDMDWDEREHALPSRYH
jgi:hypothetical protein